AEDVVRLAERHRASVYVAPMSGRCSFPETHPLFAGFLPAMRERIVELLDRHDLILVIGAPAFTYHVEGYGPHAPPGAQLCQLTDDPATAAWTPVGIAAVGNVRLGVLDLLERPGPREREMPAPRPAPPRALPPASADDRMSVSFVLQTLAEVRDAGGLVVEEAPSARPVMQRYLPIERAGTFFTMDSGGLGYGMPAAVGVALARTGERVIALIGDGSSMYSIQALWSAVQLNLPITFVILNNTRYAALQDFAPVFGFGPGDPVQGTDLPGLDFVTMAAGMGCPGVRVSEAAQLHDVLRSALVANGPMLVETIVA
ncbi:thiamine pyrophosphate protein domain protein TPP-binding, partial [Burkholderia sp. H160]